jgi:hypothetical protein
MLPSPSLAVTAQALRRTLHTLLRGTALPRRLSGHGTDFSVWVLRVFLRQFAPVLQQVEVALAAGKGDQIVAADAAFPASTASIAAGRALAEARGAALSAPAARWFLRSAMAAPHTGHFATYLSLLAAEFSISHWSLVQALLYCEWQTSIADESAKEIEDFLGKMVPLWPTLGSSIIQSASHGTPFQLSAASPSRFSKG